MCKQMNVSKSGYYKWKSKEKTKSAIKKEKITQRVKYEFYNAGEIYGYRKIHILISKEYDVSREYVRKIMSENSLYSKVIRKYKRYRKSPIAKIQNHLNRKFETKNNELVTDLTQVRVNNKWVYISAMINLKNRRVVSIKCSYEPTRELVIETLVDSLDKVKVITTLHSDQGVQYQANKVFEFCNLNNIRQSMSSRGCPYDNAVAESFFSSLKRELLNHKKFIKLDEIKESLEEYAYEFYNKKRPHQGLNGLSPFEYSKAQNLIY